MMKLKPQNTYRHLCNFAATDTSRPILQTIHFMPDGHIEATNSHILLRLLNRIDSRVDPLPDLALHPKELREFEGAYPDTSRLFPSNFTTNWYLSPGTAAEIAKYLKSLDKESTVQLSILTDGMVVSGKGSEASFPLHGLSGDQTTMSFKCKYLICVMAFIADCSPMPVQFRALSPIRPMVFKIDGLFEGLIAPVRTK